MAIIKAPYNFVPLNKKVVSPYWAEYVSHDVPFEDGESGEIEIEITAATPIFVKRGMGKKEAESYFNNNRQIQPFRFSKDENGKFFIPGSSIKGMVRSVLEIMTFGDLGKKTVDRKYAIRDLSSAMKDKYLSNFSPSIVRCGWLRKKNGGWDEESKYEIIDCGIPGRISHESLQREFNVGISSYFKIGGGFRPSNDFEKSSMKKYKMWGETDLNNHFVLDHETAGRMVYEVNEAGQPGTLVFTGQPGYRQQVKDKRTGEMKWTGHHLEFIFWEGVRQVDVAPDVMKGFLDAYFEYDSTQWSEDWKVRREELSNGKRIPVFFCADNDGNVLHLGLSYLYKLPFKHSIKEAADKFQNKKEGALDFSDAIFGFVPEKGSISEQKKLKGRVHFSNAFELNSVEESHAISAVLSSPKASYYPNYIRQKVNKGKVNRYASLFDEEPELSGWKRYPVHRKIGIGAAENENDRIRTSFIPLKQGAKFKCTIKYHNLKRIEIGALLSALTFHNTPKTYHGIGMGKPLGLGKIELNVSLKQNGEIKEYLNEFECFMDFVLEKKVGCWSGSSQVLELITMAMDHEGADAKLRYMVLKDFVSAKRKGNSEALDLYSKIVGEKGAMTSLSSVSCLETTERRCEKEEKALSSLVFSNNLKSQKEKDAKGKLEKLIKDYKDSKIKELEQKKADLAEKERLEKEAAEEKDREAKKLEKQQQAREESFATYLESVLDTHPRKAFDELKRVVEEYSRNYHMMSDKELSEQFPDGFLPEKDHETLLKVLTQLYSKQSKKEAKKWVEPFKKNFLLKTVAKWIGEKKAKQIKFTV